MRSARPSFLQLQLSDGRNLEVSLTEAASCSEKSFEPLKTNFIWQVPLEGCCARSAVRENPRASSPRLTPLSSEVLLELRNAPAYWPAYPDG